MNKQPKHTSDPPQKPLPTLKELADKLDFLLEMTDHERTRLKAERDKLQNENMDLRTAFRHLQREAEQSVVELDQWERRFDAKEKECVKARLRLSNLRSRIEAKESGRLGALLHEAQDARDSHYQKTKTLTTECDRLKEALAKEREVRGALVETVGKLMEAHKEMLFFFPKKAYSVVNGAPFFAHKTLLRVTELEEKTNA